MLTDFQNSFTDRLTGKFATSSYLNIPSHLKWVATNRLTFGEVMGKSLVSRFLTHSVDPPLVAVTVQEWLVAEVHVPNGISPVHCRRTLGCQVDASRYAQRRSYTCREHYFDHLYSSVRQIDRERTFMCKKRRRTTIHQSCSLCSTRKVKLVWILLKQETVSGSGAWRLSSCASDSTFLTVHQYLLYADYNINCPVVYYRLNT